MSKCSDCKNYNGNYLCSKKRPKAYAEAPADCPDFQLKSTQKIHQFDSEAVKRFGHPVFYKLLNQMAELHSRKNHDYAGTKDPLKNLRACERLSLKPFLGVLVRLQDKWSRLEEFVNSGTLMVKNESVVDTLMDNAVYSLLAIILYQEQQNPMLKIETPQFCYCPDCETKIQVAENGGTVQLCKDCGEKWEGENG